MESKVKNHHVIMALSIEDKYNHRIYGRKYYLVQYEDNIQQVYLTTNEPVFEREYGYDKYDLDDEYVLIPTVEQMLEDFEKSELIGLIIPTNYNGPPKYIYYDIITIHENIRPLILKHLNDAISGFTGLDLSQLEMERINNWRQFLTT